MNNVAIKVANLSKLYRLGEVGTGTISHDINRWWYRIRGKEDPYAILGEENQRDAKGSSEWVWALKDVNFSVEQGVVFGIIGKNGAGKSTLLKLLSRVTAPTTGVIHAKGRIASLLEVGTGFHPDLSGRDNIYLNGAILGMTRREIRSKFDEIIEFAGVSRYVDTPVKRYSSGMYVRLAFAVAAHLEPEILIVDEVLAVGDAEFQKKCLGKMKDVSSNEGRTVLFVSHNMTAIKGLCNQVLYMRNGTSVEIGPTNDVINSYLSHNVNSSMRQAFDKPSDAPGNDKVRIRRLEVCPVQNDMTEPITINTAIDIEFEFWNFVENKQINLSLVLNTIHDECVFNVGSPVKTLSVGLHKGVCKIPGNLLNDGIYKISMMVVADGSYALFYYQDAVSFEVNESRNASGWHGKWIGVVRPKLDFNLEQLILEKT
jgi:lipopolysaccharide transport system ATP-binding protein